MFRKLYRYVCKIIGYAYDVCSFQYGNNQVTLRADGLVTISDGKSSDMLPINLCPKKLIDKINEEVKNAN